MAKRKKLFTRTKLRRYKRDRRVIASLFAGIFLTGMGTVLLLTALIPDDIHPRNLVWAADESIAMPAGLASFLQSQDDCKEYKGKASGRGVGLWSVYQVSDGRLAKVAYGCSVNLTFYVMAVKDKSGWQLLKSSDYFSGNALLPKCEWVESYSIPNDMEPYCVQPDGVTHENKL